jgi:sialate O-acetylesterase
MRRWPDLAPILLVLPLHAALAQPDAGLSLAHVFGEHMVLQREQPIRLWGRGTPGLWAEAALAGRRARAQVGSDGRWQLSLDALPAGGPHALTVASGTESLQLADVVIGDVWLCGGQSNMAWPLAQSSDARRELAAAGVPQIRELRVPERASARPGADIAAARWVVATPATVGEFSAVAYHFARRLHAETGVAVGLVVAAWNGSPLETWLSRDAALGDDDLAAAARATPPDDAALAASRQRRLAAVAAAAAASGVAPPWSSPAHDAPSLAHNGMIYPLRQLALSGMLWYQGESNVVRAARYVGAFQRLIADWRRQFGQGDLPFLYVQLAPFGPLQRYAPGDSAWAELRDAQRQALALPGTAMAVTTDIDRDGDLHPRDKRSVGERLARLALHLRDPRRPAAGTVLRAVQRSGSTLRLQFDRDDLATRPVGSALQGFALAGADRSFRAALARIEGRQVVVWHPDLADPVAVRFGWVDNPSSSNLVDGQGLPASPFRSDDWPLTTAGRRYAP